MYFLSVDQTTPFRYTKWPFEFSRKLLIRIVVIIIIINRHIPSNIRPNTT